MFNHSMKYSSEVKVIKHASVIIDHNKTDDGYKE